jgi:hypothetical protein
MKIKEFFENCDWFYHVYVYVDESVNYQTIDSRKIYKTIYSRKIYTKEELDNFINAYGNEEIKAWKLENCEDDTIICFVLKRE